jgi:hypothetical protein
MGKKNVDDVIVFGNTQDRGDLAYVSNYYPFGRAALIIRNGEKGPVIITDAILHGEPINSYIWTIWIKDFRPVHRDSSEFALTISKLLREDQAEKIGIVGMDSLPMMDLG